MYSFWIVFRATFDLSLIASAIFPLSLSASDSPPVWVHRSARHRSSSKPEVDRGDGLTSSEAWERRGSDRMLVIVRWEKDGDTSPQDGKRGESQDKFAPRVTVWPRAAGQTSARSVQCHAGRPGAQIIHNCIANVADVDVVFARTSCLNSKNCTDDRARARYITCASGHWLFFMSWYKKERYKIENLG